MYRPNYTSRSDIATVLAILLIILILFSLPLPVDTRSINDKTVQKKCANGFSNSFGACECYSGFYGSSCNLKYCPFADSWSEQPNLNHTRTVVESACSGQGYCDTQTGVCKCRDGFEGRACERKSCPTSKGGKPCHGHGRCMTMREAALEFNGRSLVNPPISYNGWDADKLMGCVCDQEYGGYDCSQKQCPTGWDPEQSPPDQRGCLDSLALANSSEMKSDCYLTVTAFSQETLVLQCQASEGYFSLLILGSYTQPIPYDADPGLLKGLVEAVQGVGRVRVSMSTSASHGYPIVCGSTGVASTEIQFSARRGRLRPVMVSRATSNTRMWRDGSTPLSLNGDANATTLRMSTIHTMICQACSYCHGVVYFTYKDSVSSSVNITDSSAPYVIQQAILGLADLVNEGWPELSVNVNGASSVCSSTTTNTITIELYSMIGNIPGLGLLDNSYFSFADQYASGNISWNSNPVKQELKECSGQGLCDGNTGTCKCIQSIAKGVAVYQVGSSDGNGKAGGKGDCGFLSQDVDRCTMDGTDVCSGHGFCSNFTTPHSCLCRSGWSGVDCSIATCPKGPSWFDEAISVSEAHQLTECSNMGICDRKTGFCKCRAGYSGTACQYFDCPRDGRGHACSGHGWCKSMHALAKLYGVEYGSAYNHRSYPGVPSNQRGYTRFCLSTDCVIGAWDAFGWNQCVCSAQLSVGYVGNPAYPAVGPSSIVSGRVAESSPLPGWSGWDCSLRHCATGDVLSLSRTGGVAEIQRVVCISNLNDSFTLSLYGFPSKPISGNDTESEIKQALEWSKVIANVTVVFNSTSLDLRACSSSYSYNDGGFLVYFDTELGDLPLLKPSNSSIYVYEIQKGTRKNLECSGPLQGTCNTNTGLCDCEEEFGSSDGYGGVGNRGDCGYYNKYFTDP